MLCRSNFHGVGSIHGPWVQLSTAHRLLEDLMDIFATHFSTSRKKTTESQSDVRIHPIFPHVFPIFAWWKPWLPGQSRRPPGGPAGWQLPAAAALAAGGRCLRPAARRGQRRAVPLAELLGPKLAAAAGPISRDDSGIWCRNMWSRWVKMSKDDLMIFDGHRW